MLLKGCLRLGSAIRAISRSVFFVVAASRAIGNVLIETGATGYVTDVFLINRETLDKAKSFRSEIMPKMVEIMLRGNGWGEIQFDVLDQPTNDKD